MWRKQEKHAFPLKICRTYEGNCAGAGNKIIWALFREIERIIQVEPAIT